MDVLSAFAQGQQVGQAAAQRQGQGQQTRLQQIPVPYPTTGVTARPAERRPQAGIVVKQTVKQEHKSTSKRNTRIRKTQKGSVAKSRKRYNALKKAVKKAVMNSKKAHYGTQNENIKKLPAKSRKAARAKLRAMIKSRLQKILGVVKPGTSYKTIEQINRAIVQLKKVKW